MIQASYEGILQESIASTTGAKTFTVSPALTNADGILKVGIGLDNEEWFEVTGVNVGNTTITTGIRGLSLTTTNVLTEVAGNRKAHYPGEKIAIVVFPNSLHSQNTDTSTSSTTFTLDYGGNEGILSTSGLTGDRTYTFQDRTGKLADEQYVAEAVVALGTSLGDVVAGSSSTDNALVRYHLATGRIIQTTGITIGDDNSITTTATNPTGYSLSLTNNSLTTGGGIIYAYSNGTDTNTRNLVSIVNDNVLATGSICLKIQQDANYFALNINSQNTTSFTIQVVSNTLTGGGLCNFTSNSSDASSRNLILLKNDNASATGTVPLYISNGAPTTTNFTKIAQFVGIGGTTIKIWLSDGTGPNGTLTGALGDICFNGSGTGQAYYCTGTTNWTAM